MLLISEYLPISNHFCVLFIHYIDNNNRIQIHDLHIFKVIIRYIQGIKLFLKGNAKVFIS